MACGVERNGYPHIQNAKKYEAEELMVPDTVVTASIFENLTRIPGRSAMKMMIGSMAITPSRKSLVDVFMDMCLDMCLGMCLGMCFRHALEEVLG